MVQPHIKGGGQRPSSSPSAGASAVPLGGDPQSPATEHRIRVCVATASTPSVCPVSLSSTLRPHKGTGLLRLSMKDTHLPGLTHLTGRRCAGHTAHPPVILPDRPCSLLTGHMAHPLVILPDRPCSLLTGHTTHPPAFLPDRPSKSMAASQITNSRWSGTRKAGLPPEASPDDPSCFALRPRSTEKHRLSPETPQRVRVQDR